MLYFLLYNTKKMWMKIPSVTCNLISIYSNMIPRFSDVLKPSTFFSYITNSIQYNMLVSKSPVTTHDT